MKDNVLQALRGQSLTSNDLREKVVLQHLEFQSTLSCLTFSTLCLLFLHVKESQLAGKKKSVFTNILILVTVIFAAIFAKQLKKDIFETGVKSAE